jgi:excisionase family DNA binding protein
MQAQPPFASPYLTVGEVAAYLRLSLRQVRRLIASGDIPVTRLGRPVRVHKRDLEAFLSRPPKLY